LEIKGTDYKTTFIMGAGATRGAIPHVLLNRKRLKAPLNSDFFDVAATYVRARGAKSADAQRLARLRRVFREDLPIKGLPGMEEAFSLLYVAKDFPEIYATRRGRKPLAGERQEIKDFLRLTFGVLTAIDGNADATTGYDRLAGRLGTSDTIVTLNYDTLMDSALVRRGWNPKIGYCLGGGKRKIEWQPEGASIDPNVAGVRLLKLHGSVNWYVRGSFGSLAHVFESKPVRVSAPRVYEIRGYIRQIVPPIFGKFFGHAHWRTLWGRAFKALCDADVLVVIGCSLVDTDFHLRALLSRVTRWRKKNGNPFRRAYLVDDDLKVRRKWEQVLKGRVVQTLSIKGFEKFLSQELKA
jgi:hypothetical protein